MTAYGTIPDAVDRHARARRRLRHEAVPGRGARLDRRAHRRAAAAQAKSCAARAELAEHRGRSTRSRGARPPSRACASRSTPSPTATRRCCSRARAARARSSSRARCTSAARGATSPLVVVNCAAVPPTAHRGRALRPRARRVHGRRAAARRAASRPPTAARCSSTRSARCRSRRRSSCCASLQEGDVEPVGSDVDVKVDVRLVSATNRDLKALWHRGQLPRAISTIASSVFELHLAPLRERLTDLPLLIEQFLREYSAAGRQAARA